MLKQVYTVVNDLQMVEVSEGLLPVVSVRMFRHAANHDDGIESWVPEVTVRAFGTEGGICHLTYTHKSTEDHGMEKLDAANLIHRVLLAGAINLCYWNHQCNH